MIWTHNRSISGQQQSISRPVSLLTDLLTGLFSHLRLFGGLEHLKIDLTRLIDKRFPSVMGECEIVTLKVCRLYSKKSEVLQPFNEKSSCFYESIKRDLKREYIYFYFCVFIINRESES